MFRSDMKISIVVPVLNEERILDRTLSHIPTKDEVELIVVDGGSTDSTIHIAKRYTDKVFVSERGRAHQMNYGAERAEGDILLFLHADCLLPENAFQSIRETLKIPGVVAGAFDLSIEHPSFCFRIIEFGANIRSHITRVPYGDQALFIRKELFQEIGGFAKIPLMEDIEIGRRLKRLGKIVFVRPPVKASPRRWLAEGLLYTTLRDWYIALLYTLLGVTPERLRARYRDVR